jgi:hypothetical protein
MRDQRLHVERARSHQVEHGLEVALLGPAHVTHRVVLALVLVERVVAPRPVRAGDLEAQLLLVEIGPRQLEAGDAHQHDTAALAAHVRGLGDRLARGGGGGEQHGVHAAAAGELPRRRDRVLAAREVHAVGAEAARQREPVRVHVHAEHAAAVGAQDLHGDEADEAEARDHHRLAERRLREADALQRDRAEHREGRARVVHAVRDAGAEVLRHRHGLGVLAVRDHALAHREPVDAGAHLEHPPDVAVAERQRLVELALHGLERGGHAVRAHLLEHLAHLVRLLAHLVEQRTTAEVDQHPLGARRDQRKAGADQQGAGTGGGAGDVRDEGLAVPEALEDLLHAGTGAGIAELRHIPPAYTKPATGGAAGTAERVAPAQGTAGP